MNGAGVKTTMKTDAVEKIVQYSREILDFQNLSAPPEYRSLSVCLIESVYSLRAKYYSVVLPIVERYADKYLHGDKYAAGDSLEDFMQHVTQAGGCECFTDSILVNHQKLSGRNKTEICCEIADKLTRLLGINTLKDFQSYDKPELLDIVLRSVKGLGDAGINYLYMLAGDSNRCKPDIHIHHFIRDAIDEDVSNEECQFLLKNAVEELLTEFPQLTVRVFDYLIWKEYQTGSEKAKQEIHNVSISDQKLKERKRRRTGKFEALKDFLIVQQSETIRLTFAEIESMIADSLCKSAYQYSAYWHPSETHTLPNMIIDAGYTIENVDLQNQKIVLKKRG